MSIPQNKDWSALREFDARSALNGDKVLSLPNFEAVHFVAQSALTHLNIIEVAAHNSFYGTEVCYAKDALLRMAPLFWVKGLPVYAGDVLWTMEGVKVKVRSYDKSSSDRVECLDDKLAWVFCNEAFMYWTDPTATEKEAVINLLY